MIYAWAACRRDCHLPRHGGGDGRPAQTAARPRDCARNFTPRGRFRRSGPGGARSARHRGRPCGCFGVTRRCAAGLRHHVGAIGRSRACPDARLAPDGLGLYHGTMRADPAGAWRYAENPCIDRLRGRVFGVVGRKSAVPSDWRSDVAVAPPGSIWRWLRL